MELYAGKEDFTTSLEKSLSEIDPRWRDFKGLIVAGTHTPTDVEEKIEKITQARRDRVPFLGICFGFQLMAISYARSALGKIQANSTEINPDTNFPVVVKMNDLRVGMKSTPDLWGNITLESHWHNYKINNEYDEHFVKDWKFVKSYDPALGEYITEIMVYKPAIDYSFVHMGVQFHPEYQSSKEKPHWVLEEFLKIAKHNT